MCGQKSPGVLQRSLGDVLAREHHGDLPYPLVGRELPHVALRAFGRVGLLHFVVMALWRKVCLKAFMSLSYLEIRYVFHAKS